MSQPTTILSPEDQQEYTTHHYNKAVLKFDEFKVLLNLVCPGMTSTEIEGLGRELERIGHKLHILGETLRGYGRSDNTILKTTTFIKEKILELPDSDEEMSEDEEIEEERTERTNIRVTLH